MQKLVAGVLILLIASGASARTAFASTAEHDAQRVAKVKMQVASLSPGTSIKVKLKDHRQIHGEFVARSEDTFDLAAPEPITVGYIEVKSVADDQNGQASPGSNQYPPQHQHHGHFLRNAVIAMGVCFAFALVVAVASK